MSKASGTTTRDLHLNADGSAVIINANVAAANQTNATSTTTGALIVYGGIGLSKKLYVGDGITIVGTSLISKATRYPCDWHLQNASGNAVGEYWYDTGHNSNVTTGVYYWRQYSPNSTANTSTTGKYETYNLPAVAAGLAENKTYAIITTKNLSSITTVGTVTSGTWNATKIALKYGGTGVDGTATAVNTVFAGPSSGSNAGNASFRSLVAADLPTATTNAKGIVQVGTNISVSSGTISVATATTSVLGVMIVGTGLGVSSGTVSVTYGTEANKALQGNQKLFKLNNEDKTAASAASFYAPTAGGTANHILIGAGTTTAPTWTACATLASATSTTANTAAWDTLTLGNSANVNTTTAHSEGKIVLYSAATAAHTIVGASTTAAYTHTLPNATGTIALTSSSITGTSYGISYRHASLVKGTNPSAETWLSGHFNYEKTGGATENRIGGGIESMVDANGNTTLYLRAYKFVAGTSACNNFMISCAKDGTCSYYVSNPTNFRTAITAAAGNGRIFYGTCDTAAATGLKKVICTAHDKVLTNGDVLIVRFTVTNTCAVGSLQISIVHSNDDAAGTTAKNIKRIYNAAINNLNAKGELQANSVGVFVYDGTYWIMTNADYNNTYDGGEVIYAAAGGARAAETAANGGIGLHRYSLEIMTTNLTWSSIASKDSTATSNTTDNNKIAATAAFLLESPILYHGTNANYAPGSAGGNINGYVAVAYDLRYSCGTSSNTWTSLVYQKPVYLIGKMNTPSTFKIDATKWWGQALPNSNDGKIYIYLGIAYAANNIYLSQCHPIYWHDGTSLRVYTPGTTVNLNGTDKTGALVSIYAPTTSGTAGYLLESNGENSAPSWIQATDSNTASTIVKRDADGAFSMGALTATTGTFSGNIDVTASGAAVGVKDTSKEINLYLHAAADGVIGLYCDGYWNTTDEVKVDNPTWIIARDVNGAITIPKSLTLNGGLLMGTNTIECGTILCTINNVNTLVMGARLYANCQVVAGTDGYIQATEVYNGSVGGSTHAAALQSYFNMSKSYTGGQAYHYLPRNALCAYYSSAYNNGSLCLGYWLSGYNSGPYGGFFVCHYNTPRYVGIVAGTYTEHLLITNQNIASQSVNYASSANRAQYVQPSSGNASVISSNGHVLAMQTDCNLVIYRSGSTAVWSSGTSTSTYLVKENIQPLELSEVENLRKLNVIRFNYKKEMNFYDKSRRYGMLAEEVLPIFPDIVDIPEDYDPNNFDLSKGLQQPLPGIRYERFIPILIKAIQVQQDEIDELKRQIKELK